MMDALFWVRFGFASLCLAAVAALLRKPQQSLAGLKQFFFEPTSATNLGLLRAYVFYLLYCCSFYNSASWFATLSPTFLRLPRGWLWLGEFYPLSLRWVRPSELLFTLSSGLAMIGLFTRVSTVVASLLAVWLMGIPNFYFKIGHTSHVLVLCALVLACSPSGHALSVDALIQRFYGKAPPARNLAYTVPIRFCWLLLGSSYLFPGLWKLWESGDLWLNGHKLEVELALKWAQLPDFVPSFRIDHYPLVLKFFGTMTLVFELGFLFALFSRRTRVLAGLVATCFHFGIGMAMDIWFSLWFPLIVLIDLPELLHVRAAIQLKAKHRQAALDEHVALLARLVRENNPPMPAGTRLLIYSFDFHVDPAERAGDQRKRSLIAETAL